MNPFWPAPIVPAWPLTHGEAPRGTCSSQSLAHPDTHGPRPRLRRGNAWLLTEGAGNGEPGLDDHRVGGYPNSVTPEVRKQALRRLGIINGQVQALQRQLEEDRYCMDVLDLSLSIQKALRSLDGLVIEGHLRTHVLEQMTGGESERAVSELLRLYRVQGPVETSEHTTSH